MDILKIVNNFCCENGISVKLSYDMPEGYETAYGTYDVTINTLFLNMAILEDAPKYEVLFYLFHELRHAMQYLRPNLFSERIQESRFYVVMYNGICYKLIDNMWQKCILEGSEEYFSLAYMSLPHEIDASKFAYEKAKEICGDISELQELYAFWIPKNILDYSEHQKLFRRIDNELKKYEHERNITLELLSRRNIEYVRQIQRDDISEAFVDNTDTIMELTQYGLDHSCKGHTYAIKRDDEYIGLILMGEAFEWDTDPEEMKGVPFYRLMGFIIDKRYRNSGIGGYVLEKVIEIIYSDYGIRPIALGVHKDNIGAERFYINHGFKKTKFMEGNDYYYLRYPS